MDTQKSFDAETSDVKTKLLYASPVEACKLMNSDMKGLTQSEAGRRLETYGKNELPKKKQDSLLKKLLANFTSLMALLLWGGGIMAIVSGAPELGIAIFCVNLINGLFSFFQEFKAEKATNALQEMLPANARVIRDGQETKILASDIVPGDIMILEEGDKICADARILRSNDFSADQSTLTGESNPIRKSGDAMQQKCNYLEAENMVFSGTSAAAGTCRALVVSTGSDSEFGKIANLTQSTEKSLSPLQKELDVLTKQIAVIAFSIGFLFLIIAVFFVKDPVEDKVEGLDLGADDYLPKPFHLAELVARVRSLIRRSGVGTHSIQVGNVSLNPDDRSAAVEGKTLNLLHKEYHILYYFMTRPGRVVDKQVLAEAVWGDNADQSDNFSFLYQQVANLKRKLKEAKASIAIQAVYGFGYKLVEEA